MTKHDGAVSKSRLQRVLRIHKLLRSKRSYSLAELTDLCQEISPGVTQRTIVADIAFLREELGAPLPERGNRWTGFSYDTESSYSIFEGLDDSFAGTLDEVLAIVRQLAGKPEFLGMEELLLRLEQRAAQLDTAQTDALQFDEPDLRGRQYLLPLYRAILTDSTLAITYEPFNTGLVTTPIRPILLRQFNNRWFLLAWRSNHDMVQTYAIDRIVTLSSTHETIPKRSFNARTHFANLIGMSKGGEPVEILLRFTPQRGPYVLTKKLHLSQNEEQLPDGRLLVRIKVEINRELVARLLEFGPDIEVLEPTSLRNRIRDDLALALRHYE